MKMRSALVGSVYRKSLRLSNKARQERSTGAITNHMATDVEKLQGQTLQLHNLWSSPARIIFAMYLLYTELQAAVFVGVALLIAITPLQVRCCRDALRQPRVRHLRASVPCARNDRSRSWGVWAN